MKVYWITYATKDASTRDVYEEKKHPVPVKDDDKALPKELHKFLSNAKEGDNGRVAATKPFGEREKDLVNIVSLKQFQTNKVNPFPGLVVTLDDVQGTVKAVSGGRVVVDFNHPLAGKDLFYEITVHHITEKPEDTVRVLCKQENIDCDVSVDGKTIKIHPNSKASDAKASVPEEKKRQILEIAKSFIDEGYTVAW